MSLSLHPFIGINSHSVIMQTEKIQLLQDLGVFTQPYSADYNPIEKLFAELKSTLRTNEHPSDEIC